jgi:probable HAF family extracellular repeat protein
VTSGHSVIDMGTPDGESTTIVYPMGINAAGQVTGVAWTTIPAEERAFLWQNGVFQMLPFLEPPPGYEPAYSFANAINNHGDVVGESSTRRFVYRDGVMIDLNESIDKDESGIWPMVFGAYAINDAGQIAGQCFFGGDADAAHACVLTPISKPGL